MSNKLTNPESKIYNEPETIRKIIHNIRNMKTLTNENKKFIRELSHMEKMDIILVYDDVIKSMLNILETL